MTKTIAALIAAALAFIGSTASSRAAEGEPALIEHFTADNITAMLTELGAANVTSKVDGKVTRFGAEINGIKLFLAIGFCEPGCTGLLIGSAIDTGGQRYPAETLINFTRDYPPTPALTLNDGTLVIGRAVISTGGIGPGNGRANIALLAATVPVLIEHLKTSQVVASREQPGAQLSTKTAGALRTVHPTPEQIREISAIWLKLPR
jgi:hypothetical protein